MKVEELLQKTENGSIELAGKFLSVTDLRKGFAFGADLIIGQAPNKPPHINMGSAEAFVDNVHLYGKDPILDEGLETFRAGMGEKYGKHSVQYTQMYRLPLKN